MSLLIVGLLVPGLQFSLVSLKNTSPLKEFHQNNNINVAGNNTTVLKHTNH